MDIIISFGILKAMEHAILWQTFAQKNNLTEKQLEQFQRYYELLIAANKLFNLTAITDLQAVIDYHFQDSLQVGMFVDMHAIKSLADIGTGGGFPGIPLKIAYPHLKVLLLEVSQKKVTFLHDVFQKLGLEDIQTCDLDWRTFLRTQHGSSDLLVSNSVLFCARASLHPDELVRMFAGSCRFQESTLIYWASQEWQAGKREQRFLKAVHEYRVGDRNRRYALFKK